MNLKFKKIKSINKIKDDNSYDFAVEDVHRIIAREEGSKNAFYTSNCWHPDIEEFITAKQTPGKLTKFNMSVLITDDLMDAVKNNLPWNLEFPDYENNSEVYKKEWNGNIKEWKSKGYSTTIYKTFDNANELWDLIMSSTYNRNEPGVLFIDTVNKLNNLKYCEYISASNPCLVGDTIIKTNLGEITLKEAVDRFNNGEKMLVCSYDIENDNIEYNEITNALLTREDANVIEIETENGDLIKLTPDHKVYTENRGWVKACKLELTDIILKIE